MIFFFFLSFDLHVFFALIAEFWTGNKSYRSEERRVGKSVDLGGRRIIKKKIKAIVRNRITKKNNTHHNTREVGKIQYNAQVTTVLTILLRIRHSIYKMLQTRTE